MQRLGVSGAVRPIYGSLGVKRLTLTLDGVGRQRQALDVLSPRERAGTHCKGGWVGRRTGLEVCGKSRPSPGSDPRTVHLVASHYTD